MTKFPYDEFAKGFLESLLSTLGQVQTSWKIGSEVREIDIYFQPDLQTESIPELGLLGKLARTSMILEPFRNSVSINQIRSCLGKLFDLHAEMIREAKRDRQPEPGNADLPCLWILTPTLSEQILAEYGARLDSELA
jgi:hypothetical protein